MRKLVSLLAVFMLVGSIASAKNILVNKSGALGTYSSIVAAVAAATAGDAILINEGGTYNETATINLEGLTLKGATNPAPIVNIASAASLPWMNVHNSSVENIDFYPTGEWGCMLQAWGNFSLRKLFIDCNGLGANDLVPVLWIQPVLGEVTTGVVEYVTFANKRGTDWSGMITFGHNTEANPWWWGHDTNFTAAECGPVLFNHCNILLDKGYPFYFMWWPTDGSEITVKNSVIGCLSAKVPLDGDINPASTKIFCWLNEPKLWDHAGNPNPDVIGKVKRHNNLIIKMHCLDFNSSKPNDGFNYEPDATTVWGGNPWAAKPEYPYGAVNPFVFEYQAGGTALTKADLKLRANTSPALWKGDDGLNIGADVNTLPVELSAFEIE